ncbi:glycosyltransferase [Geothrix fuzhouensis]|uniref:glycosyltransferase n=1 Tax=Geothrix fuzhouensis TaxID=2966451 RepID=UPI00352F90BD
MPSDTAGSNCFDDPCQESEDVRPALTAAHVLALPSYGEDTPRSALEAMAMGRAIVTTDAPGCRATVQDGRNDFLVPVRDSRALTNPVVRLAADPALIARFGDEGRRIAEEKHDVRRVTEGVLVFMALPPVASREADPTTPSPQTSSRLRSTSRAPSSTWPIPSEGPPSAVDPSPRSHHSYR